MACYDEGNVVVYSSDISYCRNTYNYSLHYGVFIKVKTIVIDNQVPVDEELCISYGLWTAGTGGNPPQYTVYSRILVNGANVYSFSTKPYAIGSVPRVLKDGDVVDLYVKTPYAWDYACVNNFRISRSTVVVSGTVTSKSGIPISNATITIGGYTCITDALGQYSTTIEPGTYDITAGRSLLKKQQQLQNITADTTIDFTLYTIETRNKFAGRGASLEGGIGCGMGKRRR